MRIVAYRGDFLKESLKSKQESFGYAKTHLK